MIEHLAGTGDDRDRQPRELGDLDAVGPVGGAGDDLVEEHHVAPVFAHAHRVVGNAGESRRESGQLVIMGGKDRAAEGGFVQGFHARPGDREPVEGGGAPADFVEDDEGRFRGAVEDGGGFDHFDHEGRAALRDVVGGPDAGKDTVDHPDMGAGGGHVAAHLRQDGDQRVLAQEGRFTAHIGAGHQPELAAVTVLGRRKVAIIGDEGAALGLQRLFDHRVTPPLDLEGERSVDLGSAPVALSGQRRERGRDIELGHGIGGGGEIAALGDGGLAQAGKDRQLDLDGDFLGAGDLALELGQLGRREPHGVGEGLAVDEHRVFEKPRAVGGGDFDEKAQHIVVLDLQSLDAGGFA